MTGLHSHHDRIESSPGAPDHRAGRLWSFFFLCALLNPWLLQAQTHDKPAVVLSGVLTGKDHETYRLLPFEVPPGVSRITVEFSYTGREQHTTLDLGIDDPAGFRGWSGGSKSSFTISATDATPSYLAGPITPGVWKLVIGVPNIRQDNRSEYKANIFFESADGSRPTISFSKPLREARAWYRGDLHMHTAHSDGICKSQAGISVPCPLFKTLEVASARGLDFIAVTDHNTASHFDALRELAPYFDHLLLLHGREITTFHGHANVYGSEQFLDFRVSDPAVPEVNALLRQAQKLGGLVSINHPNAPTGEECMGCGWNPNPEADLHLVTAIEAINSYQTVRYSGIPFWESQLNRGYRLTGIGGSDSHNPDNLQPGPGAVGTPSTVIGATELSEPAILEAIRAGHVFIDVEGSGDRLLEFTGTSGSEKATMGDAVHAALGSSVTFSVHLVQVSRARMEVIEDGKPLVTKASSTIDSENETKSFAIISDSQRHWIRIDVRSAEGKLLLVGNPIYLNF